MTKKTKKELIWGGVIAGVGLAGFFGYKAIEKHDPTILYQIGLKKDPAAATKKTLTTAAANPAAVQMKLNTAQYANSAASAGAKGFIGDRRYR